jgi:Secretion system C-terminal sorting domain
VRKNVIITGILLINTLLTVCRVSGQEYEGPLRWNPFHYYGSEMPKHAAKKTATSLSLPFFEDFTGYSPYPDTSRWTDFEVYINNTMPVSPISRGVATFDDLNGHGIPYDSFNNTTFRYADSLTSLPIDLSTTGPGDSVYLSFFYQPQGRGFFPLPADSLMLFMKNRYGDFIKVWSVPGSSLQPFTQVMIPITDSLYFHDAFQFRFLNIAALYWADAVWNVDYIRLDKNRSMADTTIGDVAFTSDPTFLLNDYTSMPYNQFRVSPGAEIAPFVTDSIRNDTSFGQTIQFQYRIRDVNNGGNLTGASAVPTTIPGYGTNRVSEPVLIATYPTFPAHTSVLFETKFFFQSTASTGHTENDTIIKKQVFDNYLAYDDGTAEKSYYLHLYPSLPGKIMIEHHLNTPDTLRGMAIYFGRQVPFANNKEFAIYAYGALAGINGAPADIILDSSDFTTAAYADSVNHFWTYLFNTPILLPAGTFYAGVVQSKDGSDSLYYGLDVNRIGGNHTYYNVLGIWNPSLISGSIMMRPILGKYVSGSAVTQVHIDDGKWRVMPNPAKDALHFEFESTDPATYQLTDVMGHLLMHGTVSDGKTIDISNLAPGMYFVNLISDGHSGAPQKIIKL